MKLYLIVWEYLEPDRECEWTHEVLEEYPNEKKTKQIIARFMLDNFEQNIDEYTINNTWVSTIDEIDGYKITVTKEQ